MIVSYGNLEMIRSPYRQLTLKKELKGRERKNEKAREEEERLFQPKAK
jgi:hypothetical protein